MGTRADETVDDPRHGPTHTDVSDDGVETWEAIADAVRHGDNDEAARLVLSDALLPGLRRTLAQAFPRLPAAYVEDALAEAVGETFLRLARHHSIDPGKIRPYITATGRNILTGINTLLKYEAVTSDGEPPYDAELAGRMSGMGDLVADPARRTEAIEALRGFIDKLPSSDNAKAVMHVRFQAASDGDWLTDAEVAEVLGKAQNSISSWWRRGLGDLRELCSTLGIDRNAIEGLGAALDAIETAHDADLDDYDDEREDPEDQP